MNTLVEAAAQVFAREGVATTTNRIAERAGLSIGTLYQYYPDKLALLRAVAERHVREADERLCEVFADLRAETPRSTRPCARCSQRWWGCMRISRGCIRCCIG